jgi:hypothetical protein
MRKLATGLGRELGRELVREQAPGQESALAVLELVSGSELESAQEATGQEFG